MSFPEVPIAEADPATLDIYRKLMTAAGSSSPALIFRHMAVYPGLLDWVWSAVGQDVEAGWPREAVWSLVKEQAIPPLPRFTAQELSDAGIDETARQTIGHMLTSYNRMNPVNLIAVGAARALIAGEDIAPPEDPFPETLSTPPTAPPDLPPPLAMEGLDDDLRTAIDGICRTIPDSTADVTPTMYRHFAHWPQFMHLVARRLDVAMDGLDGSTYGFAARCHPLIGQMLAKAKTRDPGPLPLDDPAPLLAVLDTFAYVIPHMVVIGEALERALET